MACGPGVVAAGAAFGALWEKAVQGRVKVQLRFLPLMEDNGESATVAAQVQGASEGVDWGTLGLRVGGKAVAEDADELCCFVSHQDTGCTVGLFRNTAKRRILLAFRGTTVPKDLVTDASLAQTAWVEGEKDSAQMVHSGFRSSLQSISRKLKELTIAAAGGDISEWTLLVTGHSLGGALATLFAADVGEFGLDGGRGLPQVKAAEPWWGRILQGDRAPSTRQIPRPRNLRCYTFGSPRVGNLEFSQRFDKIGLETYRIVNGADVVTRQPRTVNALVASIGYEHCGRTVLINEKEDAIPLWVEDESDDSLCPVRDGTPFTNPFRRGNPLGDLAQATTDAFSSPTITDNQPAGSASAVGLLERWGQAVDQVSKTASERLGSMSITEAASMVGLDTKYVGREVEMLQSITDGSALIHHLEPAYFAGMVRAASQQLGEGVTVDELVPPPVLSGVCNITGQQYILSSYTGSMPGYVYYKESAPGATQGAGYYLTSEEERGEDDVEAPIQVVEVPEYIPGDFEGKREGYMYYSAKNAKATQGPGYYKL